MSNIEGERIRALEVQVKELSNKIDDLSTDIKELKTSRGFFTWLQIMLGGVMGSILTFLVIEFFKTH